jgi:hypothetical protein
MVSKWLVFTQPFQFLVSPRRHRAGLWENLFSETALLPPLDILAPLVPQLLGPRREGPLLPGPLVLPK